MADLTRYLTGNVARVAPPPSRTPDLSRYLLGAPDEDDEDEERRKAEARRLREERMRELAEMGALPTAEAGERDMRASDLVDRLGTAVLSNVSGIPDLAAAAARVAPLPGTVAMDAAMEPVRRGLEMAENATGLPFTTSSQERHRQRFRELEKPGGEVIEALQDTALEGAGAFIDPVAAGGAAIKALRGASRASKLIPEAGAARAAERIAGAADEGLGAGGVARAVGPEALSATAGPGASPEAVLAGFPQIGKPRAVGPTTVLESELLPRPFQTNIAAQVGGQEVADWIVKNSDELAMARGLPQGWDELEDMAVRLGTTKEEFLSRPTPFRMMQPEERVRLAMVIKGNDEDIAGLQGRLATGDASDAEKAVLLQKLDQRGSLIKLAVSSGSEYGRALNSLRMEARASLGDSALARQQLYKRYQDTIDKNKGLLDHLARLDPGNPDELQAFLRQVDKPKFREYVQEYWIASVLFGPATQIRNILGNTAYAFTEALAVRPARALVEPVVAAVQGRQREHFLREAPHAAAGMIHGIGDGLRKGFEVLRRGYPLDEAGKLLPVRSAFARSQNRVVREMVGPVVTMPLRMLTAADTVFKVMNHTSELYATAANKAAKEGLSGQALTSRMAELIANPTDDMIAAADRFALKATFNDDVSNIGKAWMALRDELPGGKFLSPFVKIADRLMARGFEFTFAGFAKAAQASGADVSDLTARAGIGSAVMLYGATLAADGRLTASAPADPAERDAFYRAGKKPWAVKIGDAWVPFGQMQPIATPLALVAAAHQGWAENGEAPPEDKLAAAAAEIGKYVTDQSYMDSLAKAFDALAGGQGAARAASDLTTQTAAGFMPMSGLTRTIAQGVDPRILDTRTIPEKLQANAPGWSRELAAKIDVWGEDVVPTAGRLRGVMAAGTPLDTSRERQNPLDVELARLGVPLGFVDGRMHDPATGKSEKLSPADHREYQRIAGRKTKEMLTNLFADPGYQEADAEAQRTVVERMVGVARQYARMTMLAKKHGWDR